ncbi:MAG: glycosyltransferase family 39 protein [bacterium]|nr:glycosyltransferase family 39 protein [bacterium]
MPDHRWLRREPQLVGLAVFLGVHLFIVGRHLIYPDLIAHYPFLRGDAHDWITNGLYLAGHDVRFSARPPLLPLVLAVLSRWSALYLYPLLAQILVHATTLGLYRGLRRDTPANLAACLAAGWLVNATWLSLSFEVMADVPAACLLTWSVLAWRRGGDREPGYVAAGLFAGLSAVTQQLALLMGVPALAALLCFRRQDLRSRRLWAGAGLFLAPTAVWLLYKGSVTGTIGDVHNRQWSLLGFHTDAIGQYAFAFVAFVGIPAAILIAIGAASFAARSRSRPWCLFLLSTVTVILVFFVFFYSYVSPRFLSYFYPLAIFFLARGLLFLRHPVAIWGLAALALIWGSFPLPATGGRLLLWPAPATYLVAPATAEWSLGRRDLGALATEAYTAADVLAASNYRRLAELHGRPRPPRGLPPETFSDDSSAIYLHAPPEAAGDSYGVTSRLGNLLLLRVKFLPLESSEAAWHGLDVEPLRTLDGRALFRAGIPGEAGSWILGMSAKGPGAAKLERLAGQQPRPDPEQVDRARRLAARIGHVNTVIRTPDGNLEPWQLYLALFLPTTELHVVGPAMEAQTRQMLGPGTELARDGDATLTEHRLFGRRWVVVE